MKRSCELYDTPYKRLKIDTSVFADSGLALGAEEVYERRVDNAKVGFLSCKCFMSWNPNGKKFKTILQENKEGQKPSHRFEVEFSGDCAKVFDKIRFYPNDRMLLSLKGVKVEKLATCTATCTLPMRLCYAAGVVIKFSRRFGQEKDDLVDTWDLERCMSESEDQSDWFARTPLMPRMRPVSPRCRSPSVSIPSSRFGKEKNKTSSGLQSISSADYHAPNDKARGLDPKNGYVQSGPSCANEEIGLLHQQTTSPGAGNMMEEPLHKGEKKIFDQSVQGENKSENGPSLTKKQMKRLRKKQKKAEGNTIAGDGDLHIAQGSPVLQPDGQRDGEAMPMEVAPQLLTLNVDPVVEGKSAPLPETAGIQRLEVPMREGGQEPEVVGHLEKESAGNISENVRTFRPGLVVDSSTYVAMDKLKERSFSHLIGVVVFSSDSTVTRTGDHTVSVKLLDPSNTDVEYFGLEGFRINFFSMHKAWLPQVKVGDVLIVRNARTEMYHGNLTGVGHKNKASWAVYSPQTQEFGHGDKDGAPESEGLAAGEGHVFSPFFWPGKGVKAYCTRLADWWVEVVRRRNELLGCDHQIHVGLVTPTEGQVQRIHRLIDGIGPEKEPSGYFNCTVEVLHGHMGDTGVYSLYVTDYTENDQLPPVCASWCLESLRQRVLKIEVWDAAVSIAGMMKAGEYWSIRNARARISLGGYLEGKLNETKCTPLDASDANRSPHLKALLERKAKHQDANQDDKRNVFQDCTIAEAVENKHFNCIVEVLDTASKNGLSYILVTDYTMRSDTQQEYPKHTDGQFGLKGRLLRIDLWDKQVQVAQTAEPGRLYYIQKLRLKRDSSGVMIGRLGGTECLVSMVNRENNQEKLAPLLSRKTLTLSPTGDRPVGALKTEVDQAQRSFGPSEAKPLRTSMTIAEIHADPKRPNVFNLEGRIIDYYPPNLRDVVVLYCQQCKREVDNGGLACRYCNDTDHEYIQYQYRMALFVEDREGNTMQMSIHDQSPLFAALRRRDLRQDFGAFSAFLKCLEPLLGGVSGRRNGDNQLQDSPMLYLTVDSWEVDQEVVYALAAHET